MKRFGEGPDHLPDMPDTPDVPDIEDAPDMPDFLPDMPDTMDEESPDLLELYLDEIKKVLPLKGGEEVRSLTERARKGDAAAKDRLAEGYLMHAVKLLAPWLGGRYGAMELIGTANLALVEAVRRHIEETDADISLQDRVTELVNEEVKRFAEQENAGRNAEMELADRVNRLTEVSRVLSEQLSREPKEEEIAERMRIPVEEVRALMKQAMQAL